MRNVLAAVGRVLAALVVMVVVWCEETGKFLLRCMPGYRPPDPQEIVEAYAEAAATPVPVPAADTRLECIQRVADDLFRERQPTPEDLKQLGDRTRKWLIALDADMLISVVRAKPSELRSHLGGDKTIRGLLAYDLESVAAYKKALEAQAAPEPKPEHTRKSRRRQQPFHAFGSIC